MKNRKVIAKYNFVPDAYEFEADTDLFKLLVGPLYGYDLSFGVREMIQNAVDACLELQFKMDDSYEPVINVCIENKNDKEYVFTITDNGKGMSLGEIKNYFLKAGASFRNSMEWKRDYQTDDNKPIIHRSGKFGIGVLASFLVGDSIKVTTKRYNAQIGYSFNADLSNEFIEVRKNNDFEFGTSIVIKIKKETYDQFISRKERLTQWYVLSSPKVNYFINNKAVNIDTIANVELIGRKQKIKNGITFEHKDYDDIIWTYERRSGLAINGIIIPHAKYSEFKFKDSHGNLSEMSEHLTYTPFLSVIDRNNKIDLELNRNNIRGGLPFLRELTEQCQLEFLYDFLFCEVPIANSVLSFINGKYKLTHGEYRFCLDDKQFGSRNINITTEGYFINTAFYGPIANGINYFRIFSYESIKEITILPNSVCALFKLSNKNGERNIIRGDGHAFITVAKPGIYYNNYDSKAIAKGLKERLKVINECSDYILFSADNFNVDKKHVLIDMFKLNNIDAVQVMNFNFYNFDKLDRTLKKYLGEPVLIPHDWEKRKAYIKTLSPELIKYITQKRGVNLD